MTRETIRGILNVRPFPGYEVRLSNGEQHQIRHPENASLLKSALFISYPGSRGYAACSFMNIAAIGPLISSSEVRAT